MITAQRRLLLASLLAGLLLPITAGAQGAAGIALRGRTLDGQAFSLDWLRGHVVMVVMWRSDCAVCLDKLPELRANARGWREKPFDIVLVNLDANRADALAYDKLRQLAAQGEGSLYSLWQGDVQMPATWRGSARLPLTLVMDRAGRVVGGFEGRIPPQAWDQVADLLP
jgi:thiol-disulfide isomerase/thioredoxin